MPPDRLAYFFMAKDPAVLFYTSDFLLGVSNLTMEERGQYITMLCLQHQNGRLSDKTIRLTVGSVSVDVLSKFLQDEEGNFYNKRMEDESIKRKNFAESRRSNGSKGGRPVDIKDEKEKQVHNHMVNHMGNVNENVIVNRNINEIQKPDEKNYDLECPEVTIGAAIQMFKYQKKQDVDKETILGLWDVFKKKNFTGQKFYNYTKDIFTHFINDLRTQKISDGTKQKLGTSAARMEALRKW
jgi:uncharacterized protein YdaU (DUF1376 family)